MAEPVPLINLKDILLDPIAEGIAGPKWEESADALVKSLQTHGFGMLQIGDDTDNAALATVRASSGVQIELLSRETKLLCLIIKSF